MNALQFYYTYTVLGINSFIPPQKVRNLYCLHHSSKKQADFMFFCSPLHTRKKKELIQKIAQALGSSDYIIVEVLQTQNTSISSIMDNLLTRFLPRGFIIFGSALAFQLASKRNESTLDPLEKTSWHITEVISLNKTQNQIIPGCILDTINDLTGPQSSEMQERKKQAWNRLRNVFQL